MKRLLNYLLSWRHINLFFITFSLYWLVINIERLATTEGNVFYLTSWIILLGLYCFLYGFNRNREE